MMEKKTQRGTLFFEERREKKGLERELEEAWKRERTVFDDGAERKE